LAYFSNVGLVFLFESEITPPCNDGACSDRWSFLYLIVPIIKKTIK